MKHPGFTRTESLLLITGIVATTTMLLPALAKNSAQRQRNMPLHQCQLNLKQLGIALKLYAGDYDGRLPPVNSRDGDGYGWAALTETYVRQRQHFQCPAEKNVAAPNPKQSGFTDYWFNRNLAGRLQFLVYDRSLTIMLGDGDGGDFQSTARYAINKLPGIWAITSGSPARRHLNGANYAFIDGHVKWLQSHNVTTNSPAIDLHELPPPAGSDINSIPLSGPTFARW